MRIYRKRLDFIFIVVFFFTALSFAVISLYNERAVIWGQTQSPYFVDLAFPSLIFNSPVGLVTSGDGSNRLFLVEQTGIIKVFENSPSSKETSVFLDIQSKVQFGGEQGLLGLSFHPNYAANGYFYVNYVANNPLRTVIARYSVSQNNPNLALQDSELILLEINQPFTNHNGGQLAFGNDGYLYIGLGDGGSAGDPFGNGQSLATLLGKILRINVDLPSQDRNYSIPPDNPYFGNSLGYREEIYAYGFRNPWRFSFDSTNGKLWVGDVGQSRVEEIDIAEKGKNYGWNIMEGSMPYLGGNQTGLELPVWEYSHDQGIAIIGGYVYHGSNLPELNSKYIYGDYGSGKIWALQYSGNSATSNALIVDTNLNISSFGLDQQNQLYICSLDGKIYSIKTSVNSSPTQSPSSSSNSTQTPLTSFTPTASSTSIATPSPTSSQSASPSNTSQNSRTPQPPREIIDSYAIIVLTTISIAIAVAVLLLFILRRRKNLPKQTIGDN